jgi:hypothetical protein
MKEAAMVRIPGASLPVFASIVVSLLCVPSAATGETRCSRDAFGNTNCFGSSGQFLPGAGDAFGNAVADHPNRPGASVPADSSTSKSDARNSPSAQEPRADSWDAAGRPVTANQEALPNASLQRSEKSFAGCTSDGSRCWR